MNERHRLLAQELVSAMRRAHGGLAAHPQDPCKLQARQPDGQWASLDLTPLEAAPQAPTAVSFFQDVRTTAELLGAYQNARAMHRFEESLPETTAHAAVSGYADMFRHEIFERARRELSDADAARIAGFAADLDVYCAVKAVESLIAGPAEATLLRLAEGRGWSVHFDHVAIRCGSEERGDAARIARFLAVEHGYTAAQVPGEDRYVFADGWNALPLYKVLTNGQVLRVFLDESQSRHPAQIIQHWNLVHGYTAHHLALRATHVAQAKRQAVSLTTFSKAAARQDMESLTPTGEYTHGLLEQVFTRPRHTPVPPALKDALAAFDAALPQQIENGKCLELVARREMPPEFARRYFGLYGLVYEPSNRLHSAPVYNYFLPAQAAHVIRTSVEAEGTALRAAS